jgi:signal transduction histidine kinase
MHSLNRATLGLIIVLSLTACLQGEAQPSPGLRELTPSLSYALSPIGSPVTPDRLEFTPERPTLWSKLTAVVWVRGTIKVDTAVQWVLGIKNPTIDSLTLYLNEADKLHTVYLTGDNFPFQQRPYESEYFLFDLPKGNREVTFYFRVRVKELTQFPVFVGTREAWLSDAQKESMGEAIFFGGILILIIYNLFIYLSTREINYVIYALTNLSASLLILALDGYAFRYFWPNSPRFNDLVPTMAAINSFVYCIFFISFTRLKSYEPQWRKVFLAVLFVFSWIVPVNLFFPGFGASVAYEIMATPYIVMQLYVVYLVIRKGYAPARYFFLGSCLYSAGGFLFIVANLNLLPIEFPVGLFLKASVLLEASLLSFALADQLNFLKNENIRITTASNLQLVASNLKLKEALDALDLFVYRSSHDIRGPLMRLKGLVGLFAVDQVPSSIYLSKLRSTTDNLEQILDKHIIYNSLKSYKFTYVETSPYVVFQEVAKRWVPPDASCTWSIDPLITWRGDEYLLKVIVSELIQNAVTFRRENVPLSIVVRGNLVGDAFHVEVEDNGTGVDSTIRPRVFEMFYRGSAASQGSGIGLPIALEAARMLKGSLTLQASEPGKTIFAFSVPRWIHEPVLRESMD